MKHHECQRYCYLTCRHYYLRRENVRYKCTMEDITMQQKIHQSMSLIRFNDLTQEDLSLSQPTEFANSSSSLLPPFPFALLYRPFNRAVIKCLIHRHNNVLSSNISGCRELFSAVMALHRLLQSMSNKSTERL